MADEKRSGFDVFVEELLGPLSGTLDPVFRKWVVGWARRVPKDNWVRNKAAEPVLGVVKQWIEKHKPSNPLTKLALERLTDVGDFAANTLYGDGGTGSQPVAATVPSPDAWYPEWEKGAKRRLAAVTRSGGDVVAFGLLLELEAEVLRGIFENIKENMKPEADPEYDPTDSRGHLFMAAEHFGATKVKKGMNRPEIVEVIDEKRGITREPEEETESIDLAATLSNARGRLQSYRERRRQHREETQEETKKEVST